MEKLPEKYRLSVESGVRVGAFLPTFVDTKNKVVVEVVSPVLSIFRCFLLVLLSTVHPLLGKW